MASSVSPPKPWERPGNNAGIITALSTMPNVSTVTPATVSTTSGSALSTTTSSQPPPLPQKPRTLNSVVNRTVANYGPYAPNRFGTTPSYGNVGAFGSYTSPYSRYGGNMYGGMGSYGGLYGGMGGMSGMGYGMGGFGGIQNNPNDPNSLTNSFSQSTQATFQIIESIVGAFGGFAQMLESTYMATHSSFFAMVSVAEQFGNLRNTLGSILGIFALLRWLRSIFATVSGRPLPASAGDLTPSNFASFESRGGRSSRPPPPSKKPLMVFILAVFGLPFIMGKLIRALARSQEEAAAAGGQASPSAFDQPQQPSISIPGTLDPSKIEFCRVMYDYTPETSSGTGGVDLSVKKGDLVAVLSKFDPLGNPSEWWRCRARNGRVGYLPSPYLEAIQRKAITTTNTIQSGSAGSSNTTTAATTAAATNQHDDNVNGGPVSKPGDISLESFQKSQFNS